MLPGCLRISHPPHPPRPHTPPTLHPSHTHTPTPHPPKRRAQVPQSKAKTTGGTRSGQGSTPTPTLPGNRSAPQVALLASGKSPCGPREPRSGRDGRRGALRLPGVVPAGAQLRSGETGRDGTRRTEPWAAAAVGEELPDGGSGGEGAGAARWMCRPAPSSRCRRRGGGRCPLPASLAPRSRGTPRVWPGGGGMGPTSPPGEPSCAVPLPAGDAGNPSRPRGRRQAPLVRTQRTEAPLSPSLLSSFSSHGRLQSEQAGGKSLPGSGGVATPRGGPVPGFSLAALA